MEQLVALSHQMGLIVDGCAMKSFVEVVKIDHLVFKFGIYMGLFGLMERKSGDISTHTACRLGKWYYEGEGRKSFSTLPGFRELEEPHKAVHQFGIAAVEARENGDLSDVPRQIKAMEDASHRVIACLDRMEEGAVKAPSM
jgi:hypothetical protein